MKIALIEENWPAIAGRGEEVRVYTVKVIEEFEDAIKAKRYWWSKPEMYRRNGMFVKVLEVKEQS